MSEGRTVANTSQGREAEVVEREVLEQREKAVDFRPATTKQKIVAGVLVFGLSALLLWVWFTMFRVTQSRLNAEYRVSWKPSAGMQVAGGPPSFFHDTGSNELVLRGSIDAKLKQDLANLISKSGMPLSPPDPVGNSYWQALDRLAFESNRSAASIELYLLILGGLSGVLGVQLRSIINFIGVACYQNKLDIVRWWPWYALRPTAGFVFGLTALLLIQIGLFQPGTPSISRVTWGLVVGILAGFGASEFADRLRLLTKTLFGEAPPEKPSRPATV
jgi:hypothetical protein